jgi:hypothetical protein
MLVSHSCSSLKVWSNWQSDTNRILIRFNLHWYQTESLNPKSLQLFFWLEHGIMRDSTWHRRSWDPQCRFHWRLLSSSHPTTTCAHVEGFGSLWEPRKKAPPPPLLFILLSIESFCESLHAEMWSFWRIWMDVLFRGDDASDS